MEIGRIQPDLVADLIVARCSLSLVVLAFHVVRGFLKRISGFPMNVAHYGNEIGCRRIGDRVVILGVGKETGVTAVEDHEGAFAGSAMCPIVVREFCQWQPIGPVVLSIVNEDAEIFSISWFTSFGLTVRLGMEGGRCVRRNVEHSIELLHEL